MKIGPYEFNIREVAGSMGDFGTLFPLAIGYIAVCGLDPAGLLVMMGLANVATGLVYRLPMPIEPMKVLAVMAIAQAWEPSLVYASAFGMGIVWLLMAATGAIKVVARVTPKSVIRGIQVALGILLGIQAFDMVRTGWILALVSVIIILALRKNRYAPAAIVLIVLGIGIMLFKGHFAGIAGPGFRLPSITTFGMKEVWVALIAGGFAQVPLTATNAVIATSSLIETYWPERKVSVGKLSLNMGLMNISLPFFGGMPLCHGAGGLAGQHYFGARTGGTNIIEGTGEILLGLFFASSIGIIFARFPEAIIGAMLLMVGIELVKFAKDMKWSLELVPMVSTVAVAVLTNMAFGYLAGLAVHYTIGFVDKKTGKNAGDQRDGPEHGKSGGQVSKSLSDSSKPNPSQSASEIDPP
ncbi:MAG: putative sulfate/molybdate transporter [Actinobacteria bacterium]|nr:putative sulfate/molybdate transporter [Actinomycetota bacterium]